MTLERRVFACNFRDSTSFVNKRARVVNKRARAYLVHPNPGGGDDRIVILVRSRSGRLVQKWEEIRHLENFRCKMLPPEHPMYWDERIWDHDAEAMASRLAARCGATKPQPLRARTPRMRAML